MEYRTGQIVEGKITGIQPYGAFVSLDRYTSGLIHISEISDGFVRDISKYVHLGETVRVKIIDFDPAAGQAKLSLKAMNKTRTRARKNAVILKPSLPLMKIGFRSVEEKMDEWIENARKEILE